MKRTKENIAKIVTFGQQNNKIIIDDIVPCVSVDERREYNKQLLQLMEQNNKTIQKQDELKQLDYYNNSHKKLKVKHIYKDVQNILNQSKHLLLPKLQLEKINLCPPKIDQNTTPGKKKKRQYHYFVKTPLPSSFNIKDLSTRSSHQHNKSTQQSQTSKIDHSTYVDEFHSTNHNNNNNNNNSTAKKVLFSKELFKDSKESFTSRNQLSPQHHNNNMKSQSYYSYYQQNNSEQQQLNQPQQQQSEQKQNKKKIQFKNTTLEDEGLNLDSQEIINNDDDNELDSQRIIKHKTKEEIKQEKEDKELQKIRYNMTFRGSINKLSNNNNSDDNVIQPSIKNNNNINSSNYSNNKNNNDNSSSSSSNNTSQMSSNTSRSNLSIDSKINDDDTNNKNNNNNNNINNIQSIDDLDRIYNPSQNTINQRIQLFNKKQKQKIDKLSQRLSMVPFLQSIQTDPNQLQIKVKTTKNNNNSNGNSNIKSKYSQNQPIIISSENSLSKLPLSRQKTIDNQSIVSSINNLPRQRNQGGGGLRRLQSQKTRDFTNNNNNNNNYNENMLSLGNDVSIDEYSGQKLAKKQQSMIFRQIEQQNQDEIQEKQNQLQMDENMYKLEKRKQDVEYRLKKNHRKLYNIALKVKKSNQLDDEYKDIKVFQKNIGYSLPILHQLKYFDQNIGVYKQLNGRSSMDEDVQFEPNDYYQMLNYEARNNLTNQI